MFETKNTAPTSANTSSSAKGSRRTSISVAYLCDGKVEGCEKRFCASNGGDCRKTTDIRHAVNFEQVHDGLYSEIRMEDRKENPTNGMV